MKIMSMSSSKVIHVGKDMKMEMEMEMSSQPEGRNGKRTCIDRLRKIPGTMWTQIWELGREDPRRVIHSLKVGVSLTLVSLLYLMEPLFKGIGENSMWAVMTVVVVLEFTAGATLCKGLNRGLGTILAGSLAFMIQYVSNESSQVVRAVFVGSAVFLIGAAATYTRFFRYIKKNYEYGVIVFLITFNLITVSSYRVDDVLSIARERFYMIAIGCGICLFMTLLVFPNWSGEDLHNSTAYKFEGLARSIQACIGEYFSDSRTVEVHDESSEDPIYKDYKAVLDSKSMDETLALHASWEPRHSRFCCYSNPWLMYVKLGSVLRQFGYTVVALHGCLRSEIQTPMAVRLLFKDPCTRLASEVSKVLTELSSSVQNRRHCSPEILSDHLHKALQDLNTAIKSQPRLFLGAQTLQRGRIDSPRTPSIASAKTYSSALTEWKMKRAMSIKEGGGGDTRKTLRPQLSKLAITSLEFSEALPFAAFASLLVEMVARLDLVIEEVEELGRVAGFKEYIPVDDERTITVTTEQPRVDNISQNHLPSHGAE